MRQTKTVDEVLVLIGGFGRFQWILVALMSYVMTTLGLQGLTMTFISYEPEWKCSPASSLCNVTHGVKVGMSYYEERCKLNRTDWQFDGSFTSIITEFDLYCDRSILKYIANSMVYLGWLFGAVFFGIISDSFGRRFSLVIAMCLMSLSGVISSFLKIYWLFVLLKVLVGAGIGGAMLSCFVLITEYTGPKKRAQAGLIVWNFWAIGLCIVTLLAYILKDWRYLNFATSAPGFLILLFYKFLPESARWYIVHGRIEDAEKILHRVARVNKVHYPDEILLQQTGSSNTNIKGSHFAILGLFKSCGMAIRVVVCFGVWFTCSMIYYGISLNSGGLGGSIYLVFFLTTIVTIPSNLTALYLLDKFGRKKILIITLVTGAVSLIAAASFPFKNAAYTPGRVVLAMVAKFVTTIAFDAAYLVTYEILPTTLRNAGMGLASACARIGSFTAPYIIFLKTYHQILPFLIFGIMSITFAIAACVLPETNNTPTRETLSQVEDENVELKHLNTTVVVQKHSK